MKTLRSAYYTRQTVILEFRKSRKNIFKIGIKCLITIFFQKTEGHIVELYSLNKKSILAEQNINSVSVCAIMYYGDIEFELFEKDLNTVFIKVLTIVSTFHQNHKLYGNI